MIPGDYPLHEFYGVIGTRPSFGTGKLYPDFSTEWNAKGHDRVSVSTFFYEKKNLSIVKTILARIQRKSDFDWSVQSY